MARRRSDEAPRPAARSARADVLAQARTALLAATRAGYLPVSFLATSRTRIAVVEICCATGETADAMLERLIQAEAARVAAGGEGR